MHAFMDIRALYMRFLDSKGISTDSRTIRGGEIYFALKGEKFDGNLFAGAALEAGASFAVVDDPSVVAGERYIHAGDSLHTLQELARHHRDQYNLPVIAITGSNGKTTTKELAGCILSTRYKVHATRGNLNNHIGVPLTLLGMAGDTDLVIVEMGANHPGEIADLCRIAEPGFGLITNIGKAHLGGFGSVEGVRMAKGELYSHLGRRNGIVFCNGLNQELLGMLAGFGGVIVQYGTAGSICSGRVLSGGTGLKVRLNFGEEREIDMDTRLIGDYNLENIIAAASIGLHFGIPAGEITKAIGSYLPRENRSQRVRTGNNTLILDAYNANPTSMNLALDAFGKTTHPSRVLILGEMYELGSASVPEHQALLDRVGKEGYTDVFLVGRIFEDLDLPPGSRVFKTAPELAEWLRHNPLKERLVLLKGSRAVALETLRDFL